MYLIINSFPVCGFCLSSLFNNQKTGKKKKKEICQETILQKMISPTIMYLPPFFIFSHMGSLVDLQILIDMAFLSSSFSSPPFPPPIKMISFFLFSLRHHSPLFITSSLLT